MHARIGSDGRALLVVAAAVAGLLVVTIGAEALAAKLSGGKRSEKIVGSKGNDRIKGKGGKDRIKGKRGNDTLIGGRGRDTLIGGKGVDRHLGGPGKDVMRTADGRRDKAINGGAGRNTCVIDTRHELSIAKRCFRIVAGGPRGGGGGGGPGPGPGAGLRVVSATGLVGCDQALPLCAFTIAGDGADALAGTVTGSGGVTATGASVTVSGTEWTAAGAYGCTSDGALVITIGSESITVPVSCAA